ncbi:MAG: glutaredoxin family protein [Lysobacterales bacterium]
MGTLILYYQPECHLCDEAEALLQADGLGEAYRKVDISGVPELLMRYEIHVPVLQRAVDGQELYWPFSQRDLEVFVREI